MASIGSLDDLVRINIDDARRQWADIRQRAPYEPGRRQAAFSAVEVVLCHGASLQVNHRKFGGSTSHEAPEPVQILARLFRRPPSSVLAKMANLDGSRPHGATFDHAAGIVWSADPHRFGRAYAVTILAARRAGIDEVELPDFLEPDEK